MNLRLTFTFLIIFAALGAVAQNYSLSGKITDSQGQPVPFASIYLKNTSIGTSANIEGEYQLKVPAGKLELIFKAIGYRLETRPLVINKNQVLDIRMAAEVYELNDVVISAGGEDAAYEIIRQAIRKRKLHLREVNSFTADVYIKGLQKLLAAPKKFLGKDVEKMGKEIGLDSNRKGIIYLSESESRLSFIQPDKYREEMISSKVSGSNRAFSFNRASDIKVNFYENIQNWDGLSNRPFISPIADNALFYYQYKFLGSTIENGQTINKIQVIPRRNADPVFRGIIYILDDSWRMHSVDLYMTKEANINFVDTLKINQQFFPVGKVYMPSSVKFEFTGGVFGFRFGGYFIAIYKNYDLNPKLNPKDFIEVLKIDKGVSKKDSGYWSQSRPVPLTEEENLDYLKKETLAAKRESKPYLDSLDKENNKFKPLGFIVGNGYNPRNRFKKEYYNFSSLRNSVFYNTVEGFGINYKAGYSKRIDTLTNKFISFSGSLRYGFASKDFYGSVGGNIPIKNTSLGFNVGSDILDLNNRGTIAPFGNSINSLFYERNFMKLYEKKFLYFSASQRIIPAIKTTFFTEWSNRKSLQNVTDYTFIDDKDREFTSNNPFSLAQELPLFPTGQAFKVGLTASYQFGQTYASYPSGKVYFPSKYPLIGLSYIKAIRNIFSSDVDYDFLSFDISKEDIKLGLYGKSSFSVAAGKFFSSDKLDFVDYKHFIGTQSLSYIPKSNTYLFLDYYNFSTPDKYLEAHFEHNFSGFIFNKVPLLRKLKLQEIAGVNHLSTPVIKNYNEVYFGLEYLTFRVLYGFSSDGRNNSNSGFRIAYGF
ncbi:DUF5686 and carboxypeptidase regulatory-like domain-containing protein [Daejeonella oryzae]|uniref:DUF5686 and carboxypeptidase regulatory-like domain-containing protein n=1 Tax=Daejeonella oryzae TaxID=1122943 RepID=UPI00040D5660|nr:DUF5686 and carboxypeptidase regulatory-like domain-containing protein [Daejeonella oryzae]